MKKFIGTAILLICAVSVAVLAAQEPVWNATNIKSCDRACLVGFMDRYMNAIYKKDPKLVPPLSLDYRMTENTALMAVGEGALWRRTMQPTTFNLYAGDPINGQVGLQAR